MTFLTTLKDKKYFKWYLYGSVMTLISLGTYFVLEAIVNVALKSQMNLDPNGEFFRNWVELPIPITFKYFLFHFENPEEILNGGKPRVSEKGPYTFRMWRRKEIIEWAEDRSAVKYFEYRKYEFDIENTKASLDERITTINPIVATFGATVTKNLKEYMPLTLVLSPFVYRMLNLFLTVHKQKLFTTQTVRELIYGKRIEMLDTITTLMKPLDWLGITLKQYHREAIPPNNTYGLLVGRNNAPEGPYEVYTGITNTNIATHVLKRKDEKTLKVWKTNRCNMINGSDGSLFKIGLSPIDSLYTFAGDLCRSTKHIFDRKSEHMGIPSLRFIDDPTVLMGTKSAKENECFCLHKDKRKCEVDGLFDLSHCRFGAPLLLSKPHFLSFPHLQRSVDGLLPNENNHASYMEIQPKLGITLYCIKRMMFVIRVENNPSISAYRNMKNNFIPFFWIEVEGGLNSDLANQIMYSFVYPIRAANITSAAIGITGVVIIVTAVSRQWFSRVANEHKKH